MINKLILLLGLIISMVSNGKSQDTIIYMKDMELKGPMLHFWDSIHEVAEQMYVLPLFEKHGIKLSCAECSRASFTAILVMDRNSKCSHIVITEFSLCGSPLYCDIEEVLGNYLAQVAFPTEFKNIHLISRFGRFLKC